MCDPTRAAEARPSPPRYGGGAFPRLRSSQTTALLIKHHLLAISGLSAAPLSPALAHPLTHPHPIPVAAPPPNPGPVAKATSISFLKCQFALLSSRFPAATPLSLSLSLSLAQKYTQKYLYTTHTHTHTHTHRHTHTPRLSSSYCAHCLSSLSAPLFFILYIFFPEPSTCITHIHHIHNAT